MLGEIAVTSSLMFCFKSTVVLGSFRKPCSSEEEVLQIGTRVPMNIEVPTKKYPRSHDKIGF
jgi:hypothetical protein